jgi:hypothetical protein
VSRPVHLGVVNLEAQPGACRHIFRGAAVSENVVQIGPFARQHGRQRSFLEAGQCRKSAVAKAAIINHRGIVANPREPVSDFEKISKAGRARGCGARRRPSLRRNYVDVGMMDQLAIAGQDGERWKRRWNWAVRT